MRTLVTLGLLAVATALLGRQFGLHSALFIGAEIALLVSMFVISRYVLPLLDRRDRGAQGEEHVGELLGRLPEEHWRVIHDASLGNGNVDHIAIGPAGVFSIETKSHPGPVRAGRLHGAMIAQARAQARAVEEVTGVRVEPLIVFSRAWVDKPGARRKGVRVVPARMLVGHLLKQHTVLTRSQVRESYWRLADALNEQAARERAERWRPLRSSLPRPPRTRACRERSVPPFGARPAHLTPESEKRRARIVLAIVALGIAAMLLAYAVSPSVRHAIGHAAHSVKHAVSHVLDKDEAERVRKARTKPSASPGAHGSQPQPKSRKPGATVNPTAPPG